MTSQFSGELEKAHQAELGAEKIRITRITIVLAFLLNGAYALLDLWALPSAVSTAWLIRALASLVLLPVFLITWHRLFLGYYVFWVVLIFTVLGAAINTLIFVAAPGDLARDVYYSGLMLITMGVYSLTYIKLWQSFLIASSLVVVYVFIAVLVHDYLQPDQLPTLLSNLFFFVSMVLIGLVGQSVRDRYARDNFLLRHLLEKDVRIHEEAAKQARWLANHDALTELPNRLQLDEAAGRLLQEAADHDVSLAVIYVDLDNFKPVNDQHGHGAGDRVLKTIAARLRDFANHGGLVARIGGDEFLMVLPEVTSEQYHSLPALIGRSINLPIEIRGDSLKISASVGIARFPDQGHTLEELMAAADADMYRTKHNTRRSASLPGRTGTRDPG